MEDPKLKQQIDGINGEIKFDTSGGVPVAEQQEILDKINSLVTEKSLVSAREIPVEGKKRGLLFPVIVNIAAFLILALGFFLLLFFFNRDDQDIREGSAVLNHSERMLIQEIRQETSRQLHLKDQEINEVLARLEESSIEYQELRRAIDSMAGVLQAGQMERADQLLRLQDEDRTALTALLNERAAILEDARLMEQSLRAQAEERARELSARIEQSEESLALAMEELARLSGDQDRTAAVEAQLAGYFTLIDNYIIAEQYYEAASTLDSLKLFLNSPLFFTSRYLEARRMNQLAVVAVLEKALAAAGDFDLIYTPDSEYTALAEQLSAHTDTLMEQETTITALNARDAERERLLTQQERTIRELQTANASQQQRLNEQQQSVTERDSTIQALRAESAAKDQTLAESRSQTAAKEAENADLIRRNEELETRLETIRLLLPGAE